MVLILPADYRAIHGPETAALVPGVRISFRPVVFKPSLFSRDGLLKTTSDDNGPTV